MPFEINDDFKHKHTPNKKNVQDVLVLIADSEASTITDEKEVQQEVNLDRKAYVESVLYKTMKREKTMPKQALIDFVHKGVVFP